MSAPLINRSPDLVAMKAAGFELEIQHGYLVVHGIPYVDQNRQVRRAKFVTKLNLAGDTLREPDDHTVFFTGKPPCDTNGSVLAKIIAQNRPQSLTATLTATHMFSSKPKSGRYETYLAKISAYEAILGSPAYALDPTATARTFRVLESVGDNSPLRYADTASSRAGIVTVTQKLALPRIDIVGMGGTGGYILDPVAKTPVQEIRIYDGDYFLQHSALRAPGAAPIDVLRETPLKVDYFAQVYSAVHKGIKPFPFYIDKDTVDRLKGSSFVFLAIDEAKDKPLIIERLVEWQIPFVDAGLGVHLTNGQLHAMLRTTTFTPAKSGHIDCIPTQAANDGRHEVEEAVRVLRGPGAGTPLGALDRWQPAAERGAG